MPIKDEDLIQMYEKMLTIRRFEERAASELQNGRLMGAIHSSIGQEAVAMGVCANLKLDDRIVSNHRGHGHCIAKGADVKRMMAEIYGKKTGYCKGKGGSMHIADFSIGMLGANGIVGAGLPIAVGSALAAQIEGLGKISVVFFGDGACQEGEFHESLNLAAIWNLPIVFACENNHYGVNTAIWKASAVKNVADRASAYAMPGIIVDGNDVTAVYETARKAVAKARAGEGPSLLEFKTYRWHGHIEGDMLPDLRPSEEVDEWKKKCPIKHLERLLIETGMWDRRALDTINERVLNKIEEAVEFAVESPFPDPEDALEDIFST